MRGLVGEWERDGGCAWRQVLISGCADYSMFAHVLTAFEDAAALPGISALDICDTPLKLNEWYGQRVGAPITTIREDMLYCTVRDHYDLIVTSSFLGYFSPDARKRVFGLYAQMLRPGGRLAFSNRLREGDESVPVGFSPEQTRRFSETVVEKIRLLPAEASLPADRAASMAVAYAGRRHPYPVRSIDTIRALAHEAGLAWVEGGSVMAPPAEKGLSGPTLGDGSEYAFVMLEKPR